jgi:hypothetical protein
MAVSGLALHRVVWPLTEFCHDKSLFTGRTIDHNCLKGRMSQPGKAKKKR